MYQVGELITASQAMKLAIEVGQLGLGYVSPNPAVGCVIVDKSHCFLSSGSHLKFGQAHAEVNALAAIDHESSLENATVYITLEPCAHEGQTGSCAKRLSQLPISKVVYGTLDPNPLVSGKGLNHLKAHGKSVEHFAEYEPECKQLAEQFLYHIKNRSPFVALKAGVSLDGKMALNSGESQWITNEEARTYARQLRGHYDATFIGAGSLQYDDPQLDFRGTSFENEKENKIVILDPKGRASENFKARKLFQIHGAKNIFVLTRQEHISAWSKNLVNVVSWESTDMGWRQALENLYHKGIYSLYVEGGSFVFGQFLTYQLAQKLYLFQANKIIGEGVSWTQLFKVTELDQSIPVSFRSIKNLSDNRLVIADFN